MQARCSAAAARQHKPSTKTRLQTQAPDNKHKLNPVLNQGSIKAAHTTHTPSPEPHRQGKGQGRARHGRVRGRSIKVGAGIRAACRVLQGVRIAKMKKLK